MKDILAIGDQIAYVPLHADGNVEHQDVQFGFITGFNSQGDPFCRYWRKDGKGLRTTANSECTPKDMVIKLNPREWKTTANWIESFIIKHYGRMALGRAS